MISLTDQRVRRSLAIGAGAIALIAFTLRTEPADARDPWAVRESQLSQIVERDSVVALAMADGSISVEEVRTALSRAVGCLSAAGVEVIRASFEPNGNMSLTYVGGRTEALADEADQHKAACFAQHFDSMAEAYGLANHPTDQELQRYHEAIRECLVAGGAVISDDGATEDRALYRNCASASDALIFGG